MPNHVFFVQQDVKLDNSAEMQCLVFPHPKYGKAARYLIVGSSILEMQRVCQDPSSWFLGNTTQANGSFCVATRVDPLFLAIPFLLKSRQKTEENEGKFMELKQIFVDAAFPHASRLISVVLPAQLDLICDQREGWNSPTYRINDAKLQAWLKLKVRHLCDALSQHHSFQSVVPLTVTGGEVGASPFQRDAIGLLSEYLAKPLVDQLLTEHGYPLDTLTAKRKSTSSHDVTTADADTSNPAAGIRQPVKEKPTAAANKLANINTKGMKSLASYFGAKSPPDKKAKT